jgi:hypothetical protein
MLDAHAWEFQFRLYQFETLRFDGDSVSALIAHTPVCYSTRARYSILYRYSTVPVKRHRYPVPVKRHVPVECVPCVSRLPRCLFTGRVPLCARVSRVCPVCVPAPPGRVVPVKRPGGARDNKGHSGIELGDTRANTDHTDEPQNHPKRHRLRHRGTGYRYMNSSPFDGKRLSLGLKFRAVSVMFRQCLARCRNARAAQRAARGRAAARAPINNKVRKSIILEIDSLSPRFYL